MTAIATKTPNVSEVIANIVWKIQAKGVSKYTYARIIIGSYVTKQGDVWEVYQDIASYLLQATSENVSGRRKKQFVHGRSAVQKTTSQLLHVRNVQLQYGPAANPLFLCSPHNQKCPLGYSEQCQQVQHQGQHLEGHLEKSNQVSM